MELETAIWAINVEAVKTILAESNDPRALASENSEHFENSPLYQAIIRYNQCQRAPDPQDDEDNKAKLLAIMTLLLDYTTFPQSIIQSITCMAYDHAAPALIDFFVAKGADPLFAANPMHPSLLDALRVIKPNTVRTLLKYGATYDKAYFSLADRASLFGKEKDNCLNVLEQLKTSGLAIDVRINAREDEKNITTLMHAVKAKEITVTEWLLKNGADPNAKDSQGKTPLMYLASKGHHGSSAASFFELLIKHGASTQEKDVDGHDALYLAQEAGNTTLVNLLKAHHASQHGTDAVVSLSRSVAALSLNPAPPTSCPSPK